jgi:5-methylcytosine-specific restriction endonuclease McrA
MPIDRTLPPGLPGSFEVDHIVPLSLGGWDAMDNVQATHKSCNAAKSNKYEGFQQLSLIA